MLNTMKAVVAVLLGLAGTAFAQSRDAVERSPETPAPVQCDRFGGAAKEQCLQMERRGMEGEQARAPTGRCDQLVGPERQHCLQQGGTVEASTNSSSVGASAPPPREDKR